MADFEGRKIIMKCVYGSHLFGTSTPNSDTDYKGIVIPTSQELKNKTAPTTSYSSSTKANDRSKNKASDIDTEFYTLKAFIRLCQEGQTVATEMLFIPPNLMLETSPEWEFILRHREELLHSGMEAYYGYARKQASKYGIKGSRITALREIISFLEPLPKNSRLKNHQQDLNNFVAQEKILNLDETPIIKWVEVPSAHIGTLKHLQVCDKQVSVTTTVKYALDVFSRALNKYGQRSLLAEKNEGVDWKALSHAVRVGDQALELLKTQRLTFPRPNAKLLTEIKLGHLPYEEVQAMAEDYLYQIKQQKQLSLLPDTINMDFWNLFVEKCYQKIRS